MVLLNQLLYHANFAMPSGGSHHHVFPRTNASLNVVEHRVGRSEIHDHIYIRQTLRGQPASLLVVDRGKNSHLVVPFVRHLGHQRPSLTAP
jgi:hypothetical protein